MVRGAKGGCAPGGEVKRCIRSFGENTVPKMTDTYSLVRGPFSLNMS